MTSSRPSLHSAPPRLHPPRAAASRKRLVEPAAAPVLAAIDVGTNAVRLLLARPQPDGSLETIHSERDPIRPGEGVFKTGEIPPKTAERLLSTMRRYGALCRRYRARVRAVATSAVREARNGAEVVRRVREEAGVALEVVSGKEEARLICLGVLYGRPANQRSLIVDIGGGSTEVASALGERPTNLWSVAVGAVRLTELFGSSGKVSPKELKVMRQFAAEAFADAIPRRIAGAPSRALGTSGTIQAVLGFACRESGGKATPRELTRATERIAAMGPAERRQHFDPRRAEIIVAGAVILEAVVLHLGLESIRADERGLRNGLLIDLLRRTRASGYDRSLSETAQVLCRRFLEDDRHSRHVTRLALALFDQTADLHQLPANARPLLEVAATLHDIGNAVNPDRHHKHSWYLIRHADIPGLSDKERELVALVARFHRRGMPDKQKARLGGLSPGEFVLVRKLAMLLRLADSLDRSHLQSVRSIRTRQSDGRLEVELVSRGPVDLEIWDAEHESGNFRRVFGRRIAFTAARR